MKLFRVVISWVLAVHPGGFLSAYLSQHTEGTGKCHSLSLCAVAIRKQMRESPWQHLNCKNLFPCTYILFLWM